MEALTTEPKSDGRSRRSRTECSKKRSVPKPKTLDQESAERTASALSLVYRSLLPRIEAGDFQSFRAGNGFSAPSYNRLVMRNLDFWLELAADLQKPFLELSNAEDKTSTSGTRRIIREYQEEAALELVLYIRTLPKPLREVIELKSIGLSWKAVMERLPDRVYYSVMDDYTASLRRIWIEREDLIRRLI